MNEKQNKSDKKIGLPFDAPYAYFENLNAKVLAKIEAESKPKASFFGLFLTPRRVLTIASAVLVLLIATFTILPRLQEKSIESMLANIDTEDINHYLLSDLPEQELFAFSSELELDVKDELWTLDGMDEDLLEDILIEETELEFELIQ